jgi:CMP-N-acetylneuraminic acid synthetase
MTYVAVIPARGGSKRVPGKNLRPCAGKPLIGWTIDAARGAKRLDRVILSTDDPAIAEFGRSASAEVPFLRPAELAADETPMLPVLAHLLDWLARTTKVTALVLLQPTSPLRLAEDIDGAIALFEDGRADSVVTVMNPTNAMLPSKLMTVGADRQSVEPLAIPVPPAESLVIRNGPAVLVSSAATLRGGALYGRRTLGYRMPVERSVDIDTPFDFRLAEMFLAERGAP